ncbi:DUF4328 domain-containing protein [uncultured Croceitalea sp.]|uniref:DUF4328 domain-containing protein n=1 Tax=uncultured Croceitalea sp. TaxID=1798908 RepID=UPI00374F8CA8
MTRAEYLTFCKKCKNRKFNPDKGIICGLTDKIADFKGECANFSYDKESQYIPKVKEAIRPNEQRAKWAEYLIWSMLGIGVISLISSYFQYDLLLKVQEGFPVSDSQLEMNDIRVSLIALLYMVLYIISVIVFIRWFRRAYYNLNSRANANYDEGWAAGGWFVPILCLFRPYRIMQELDDKMASLIEQHSLKLVQKSNVLIGFWWIIWILSGMIANFSFRISMRAESLEELINSTRFDMVNETFDIPLTILAILVIRNVAKKEERLAEVEEESAKKLALLDEKSI